MSVSSASPATPANGRIATLFGRLKGRRPALMPFVTAGDPDLNTTASLLRVLGDRGADLIELGIPYSDPIADGPVIAASYTRALKAGTRLDAILDMVRQLRTDGVETPMVAMSSYSIIHRRDPERFLADARAAGLDGLIAPDLPVEEAESLLEKARAAGLDLIQLVTPTTPRERAQRIVASCSGFVYYVSVAGTTGERTELPADLLENVAWLRSVTPLPICVGFGIGRPDQVAAIGATADGLIVGSALVRRLAQAQDRDAAAGSLTEEIGGFVASLAQALPRSARA